MLGLPWKNELAKQLIRQPVLDSLDCVRFEHISEIVISFSDLVAIFRPGPYSILHSARLFIPFLYFDDPDGLPIIIAADTLIPC